MGNILNCITVLKNQNFRFILGTYPDPGSLVPGARDEGAKVAQEQRHHVLGVALELKVEPIISPIHVVVHF